MNFELSPEEEAEARRLAEVAARYDLKILSILQNKYKLYHFQ